jgi:hypothetical protein
MDELKILGVDSISSGKKNVSHQSLLDWKLEKQASSLSKPADPQSVTTAILPYQEEFSLAGSPSHKAKEGKNVFSPSKNKIEEYHSLVKPYGVDEEPIPANYTQSGSGSKPLSEVLKTRGKASKSLLNYIEK